MVLNCVRVNKIQQSIRTQEIPLHDTTLKPKRTQISVSGTFALSLHLNHNLQFGSAISTDLRLKSIIGNDFDSGPLLELVSSSGPHAYHLNSLLAQLHC